MRWSLTCEQHEVFDLKELQIDKCQTTNQCIGARMHVDVNTIALWVFTDKMKYTAEHRYEQFTARHL